MQRGKMHPDWMQWIPGNVNEYSGFHAVWRIGTLLNAWILCSMIECIGFHAARLNAVDFMQHDWMQWIPCSMFESSGLYAAWPKASRLNAVDSTQHHWMQRIPCIVAQWIPIVCSGVHAARPNASRLNAVDFMQHGPKHPDGMQWIPCSEIECSVLHAAW